MSFCVKQNVLCFTLVCCVLCELCESLLALEWCKSWGVAGVKAASPVNTWKSMGNYSFFKKTMNPNPTTASPSQYPIEELMVPFAAKSSSSPRISSSAVIFRRLSSFSSALVRYGIFWARYFKKCSPLEELTITRPNKINANLIDHQVSS